MLYKPKSLGQPGLDGRVFQDIHRGKGGYVLFQ
jgi:hypothetical protein